MLLEAALRRLQRRAVAQPRHHGALAVDQRLGGKAPERRDQPVEPRAGQRRDAVIAALPFSEVGLGDDGP